MCAVTVAQSSAVHTVFFDPVYYDSFLYKASLLARL